MITALSYNGAIPGNDANTYTLFSTVQLFSGAYMAQNAGLKRLRLDMKHPASLTLKAYKSRDRGVTWEQVDDSGLITTPGTTDSTKYEFDFEPYADFKIDLLNAGTIQTGMTVDIALTDERAAA